MLHKLTSRIWQTLLGLTCQKRPVVALFAGAGPASVGPVSEPVVVEPDLLVELAPVAIQPVLRTALVRRSKRLSIGARLAGAAKLKRKGSGHKAKPVGKARANLKPKPVVAKTKVSKRSPSLFPTKVKVPTARKATTKIFIETRAKKSAEIVGFPVRKPLLATPRLKRAA